MQTTSGQMLNNYFYYSGTYLKMREVVLTYNLPAKIDSWHFQCSFCILYWQQPCSY